MSDIYVNSDLMAKRAWDVSATAAATNSATVASKAAAAGKQWVMTGFAAFYDASNKTGLVTVKKGTDEVRHYWCDTTAGGVGGVVVEWEEGNWLVGDENELVSVTLAASATSAVTGYVNMHGFHIGVK